MMVTITGIGTGYNGYITVSVSFRNGILTNVIVTDEQEQMQYPMRR